MTAERSGLVNELKAYEPELIAIRRDIHRHPETGFEETRTAKLVADTLRGWGIEVAEGIAKTGVVGTIRGARQGKRAIGLRADLDALNIDEATGRVYRSIVPGKMHACGHDGHTTMLLGAARRLAEKPDFAGTVHVIFQPAEEGQGGGKAMVDEGLFSRFPVDAVYGMHNAPGMPAGMFGTRKGPFMAASDTWEVAFRGTGGHGGAGAHMATNSTLAVGQFIGAIQTIVSRNVPATDVAVVSVGHIAAGHREAPNIIPAEAFVCGTARSYSPAVRDLIEKRLKALAEASAATYERCESRGSRTVLREAGGEIPPTYSPRPPLGARHDLPQRRMPRADRQRPLQPRHRQAHRPQRAPNRQKQGFHCACAEKSPHGTIKPSQPTSPHDPFSRFP